MQRADSQGGMSGNRDSLVSWLVRLQNDVAPDLIHLGVAPTATQRGDEPIAAQVPQQFHRRASISSRTR